MKALVVYDSGFGNTKSIAEAIAAGLSPLNAKVLPAGQVRSDDISAGDLLVVGSPINGWRPTQKTMEALARLGSRGLSGVVAAGFDTRVKLFIHGDAAKKITKTLKEAGASIVAEPMAFYVKGTEGPLLDGQTSRAAAWGEELLSIATAYGIQRSA
ncbi:flavodoxin domain-containing protein [Arthrobacter sp. AK01]|uniref:flavodoxin family protein n=1 Tax=Micrococcaceae TaxID=1268 RepID=UPI001E34F117|nr:MULTISPECIES: flavodoxin domain-containing protein [Micrococcaceae]MCD4851579.1 flavodoxin domain-containing protein [Arthrobacter sp. AK01]MCP1413822.1 flavodoxin [Paenarthrobacter sp. A20]